MLIRIGNLIINADQIVSASFCEAGQTDARLALQFAVPESVSPDNSNERYLHQIHLNGADAEATWRMLSIHSEDVY